MVETMVALGLKQLAWFRAAEIYKLPLRTSNNMQYINHSTTYIAPHCLQLLKERELVHLGGRCNFDSTNSSQSSAGVWSWLADKQTSGVLGPTW